MAEGSFPKLMFMSNSGRSKMSEPGGRAFTSVTNSNPCRVMVPSLAFWPRATLMGLLFAP